MQKRNECSVDGSSRFAYPFWLLSVYEIVEGLKMLMFQRNRKKSLEELIVRRELLQLQSLMKLRFFEMFTCLDSRTIQKHYADKREILFIALEELEAGKTHDEIWMSHKETWSKQAGMHTYVRIALKMLAHCLDTQPVFEDFK